MRRALLFAAGSVAACSGSPSAFTGRAGGAGGDTTTSVSTSTLSSSSGSGQGGTGTAGAAQGGAGPGGAASSSGSAMGGAGTSAGGQGGTGGTPCPAGTLTCNGNTKETCDGMGGVITEDCTPGICVPGLGCAQCIPGSAMCNGNTSEVCTPDGMGYTDDDCDPDQGVHCNPGTGYCEGACAPQVLGNSYVGCDYYPTVTANSVDPSSSFAVAVVNPKGVAANVKVTQGANTISTRAVAPGDAQIITLPWVEPLFKQAVVNGTSVLVTDGAYRLRSDQPVTVYQYSPFDTFNGVQFSATNDASLLLPVNAWTGNYRVVSRNAWQLVGGEWFPGFYAVTAGKDNTTVVLNPSATGGNVMPGGGVAPDGTGTIVMNEGDVLEVFINHGSGNPDPNDLTGTLVTANKPIQVIGGHQCTYIPYDIGSCDHLEESIPPIETLGSEYIVTAPRTPSGGTTPKAEMVRIVATAANTTLIYDPPQPGAPTSIANAGDYVELDQTLTDFRVSANAKILVAQYMLGGDAGGGWGDPAMAMAVATAQYRNDYLFHVPASYEPNYVNITAPTGSVVTLDGQPVSGFLPIGGTGYDIARVQLSNVWTGNHVITSSSKLGISVYGYGQYASYWYPGGGAGGASGTGMGGAGGAGGTGTGGSGGAPGPTQLVALLEDTTPYDSSDPMGQFQNDLLTVFDPAKPNLPLLELSGLKQFGAVGTRRIGTSKSKRRLGVTELSKPPTLRVFDENLQPLVNVVLPDPNEGGSAVCPTEQAIFVLTGMGVTSTGRVVKLDSNGSYVGSTSATHGVDLIVDEDRQVVWTVGRQLTRATTDLTNEQYLYTFASMAGSLDLDSNGGIWAGERFHPDVTGSVNQLVHFDVNGILISGDTLPLAGFPISVRVDRNSGLVWVAMAYAANGGVAYRDVNGQLKTVPGLTGNWTSVEPDPLDGSRAWAAGSTIGKVVHVDTNGTLIQSVGGFSPSSKWLAVMLQGP